MGNRAGAQVKPLPALVPGAAAVQTAPAAYPTGIRLNYVSTWLPARPLQNEADVLSTVRTAAEMQRTIEYLDGLGRPLQTVNWQASPKDVNGNIFDRVVPVVYDAFGREAYTYLPYRAGSNNGSCKEDPFGEQALFMSNLYTGEQVYYEQKEYEASPLNRVLKSLAPGNSWAGNNRGVSVGYETNGIDEVVRWNIDLASGVVPLAQGTYAQGQLYRTVTTDETGKRTITYKDKDGHVVLKKAEIAHAGAADKSSHIGWLCTYYIYDMPGNLRMVIQPKGTAALQAAGWAFDGNTWATSTIAMSLCFSYEYDHRNRMIIKRVPGAAETYMVYDARDRLVLSQDGNLRANAQWMVTQYGNDLNRPERTYLWANGNDRVFHAEQAKNSIIYPAITGSFELLTVTHYDNYDWIAAEGGGLTSQFNTAELATGFDPESDVISPYPRTPTPVNGVKGMVTGTQVRILGTGNYLYTVNLYDNKGRQVQVKSKNSTAGVDITTMQYSFDGKLLTVKQNHTANGMTPGNVIVLTKNQYDHAGRLLEVSKQVNGGNTVTVATQTYNALGQLETKVLGAQLETLEYEYNVRGWLTGINKAYAANPGGGGHYFGEQLNYDYGFSVPQYNGNIAGITWSSANDQQPRSYGYTYDAASRLLKADFTENNTGSWNTGLGRDYTTTMGDGVDPSLAYDANGNIKKMIHAITPALKIDELTYDYGFATIEGNKLKSVSEAPGSAAAVLGDFKEITASQSQDYDYDANGNLVLDHNKGISSITYNHLNLPASISITGKGTISYTYDAAGNKLEKIVTDATSSNTVTTTTYIGGFQYENGDLKQFTHEEGRVRRKPDGSYVYDYYVKDHLGSVRVTLTEEETIEEYRMATMELDSAQQEETYYANLAETRSVKPVAYPDRNSANKYVAKLDGRQKKAGPSILLKVSAGDRLNIQAKSWYKHNGRKLSLNRQTLAEQAAGLAGGEGQRAVHNAIGRQGAAGNALVPALMSFLNSRNGNNQQLNRKPRAYLNWVLLDENLKPFKEDTAKLLLKKKAEYTGFQQVGEEEQLKQHVKENWEIAKSGYVYIFTSNESEDADVVFEDFGVMSIPGPLLEVNHTYPFGLTIAEISSKAAGKLENKRGYNGNEKQDKEFSDGSGLELYDFNARTYDQQTGRFIQIDPKSEDEQQESLTPYHFTGNNPVRFNDPTGKCATCKEIWKEIKSAAKETVESAYRGAVDVARTFNTYVNPATPFVELATGKSVASDLTEDKSRMMSAGQSLMVLLPALKAASAAGVFSAAAESTETQAAGEGVDLVIKGKTNWSPAQNAEAAAKAQALTEDATTIVTKAPVARVSNLRTKFIKAGGELTEKQQVDHIKDLQLGGTNVLSNLQGLNGSVNASFGKQIQLQIRNLTDGTYIRNVIFIPAVKQ
jgi:RHS repeat-associated protein